MKWEKMGKWCGVNGYWLHLGVVSIARRFIPFQEVSQIIEDGCKVDRIETLT